MGRDLDALRRTDVFAEVSDAGLADLAKRMGDRLFDPGAVLFHEGDPADTLYVIETGAVRLSKQTPTDRQIILALLGPGDSFGELALFDDAPRSATAECTERVRCLVLTRDDLRAQIEIDPVIARALLRSLTRVIRRMNERLSDAAMLDVSRRLGKALLDYAEHHGRRVDDGIALDRPVTEEDLANLAGLHRTDVARVLRDLMYADIVRADRDLLVLHRPDDLRRSVTVVELR